jgi:hypothetical protein
MPRTAYIRLLVGAKQYFTVENWEPVKNVHNNSSFHVALIFEMSNANMAMLSRQVSVEVM